MVEPEVILCGSHVHRTTHRLRSTQTYKIDRTFLTVLEVRDFGMWVSKFR